MVKTIMEKWDDGLSWEWIWDFFIFLPSKNLGSEKDEEMLITMCLFEYFDECMKMKMKMEREEDEEMLIRLHVGATR